MNAPRDSVTNLPAMLDRVSLPGSSVMQHDADVIAAEVRLGRAGATRRGRRSSCSGRAAEHLHDAGRLGAAVGRRGVGGALSAALVARLVVLVDVVLIVLGLIEEVLVLRLLVGLLEEVPFLGRLLDVVVLVGEVLLFRLAVLGRLKNP